MMSKVLLFILMAWSVALVGVTFPGLPGASSGVVAAADSNNSCPNNEGDCAKKTAFSFGDCKTDDVGITCLYTEVLRFLSIAVGIAVVGGIAVGGIVYSTAAGNSSKTQKGVSIISNSILGLVLYLLAFALINFLVPGGVFK